MSAAPGLRICRLLLPVAGLLLVLGLGCGGTNGGVECQANADCDIGLSCLPTVAADANGVCAATGKKLCTKQCASDAECVKSVPICMTSCNGLKTCGTRQ